MPIDVGIVIHTEHLFQVPHSPVNIESKDNNMNTNAEKYLLLTFGIRNNTDAKVVTELNATSRSTWKGVTCLKKEFLFKFIKPLVMMLVFL